MKFSTIESIKTTCDAIQCAIASHIESTQENGFRSHLGWSVIGHKCSRYLWYHFRWFKAEKYDARMLELFALGKREEMRIRELMQAAGAVFIDKDQNQITVSGIDGHFGGSCDGIFIWPELGIDEPMMLECKTSKTGTSFTELQKNTLQIAKPQHFTQISGYCTELKIVYCLYVCLNKNNNELYFEIVKASNAIAEEMKSKAFNIITSITAPRKISSKPNFYVCNMCPYQGICHYDEQVKPNCRNCANASPVAEGKWFCSKWSSEIPKQNLVDGCSEHTLIGM